MALSPGDRIGPYEIDGALGAGGMGEVYRARDTALNRSVALKILPDAFASDADRLARFTREARTLAALNHPNIAQIYGVVHAESDGPAPLVGPATPALVMELVEGEDLSARLARGALSIDEALAVARQIAEALESAHEQGIVHRDLKPANIKLRPDGTAKVLDFGLAKATDAAAGAAPRSLSPTVTSPALMTGVGVLLGTAAYMSPEQARGREADTRSDIWAFGCVLFEMLAGRPLFSGETVTEVLASVMKDAPSFDALPPETPAGIRALLRRCLDRDQKQRLRDVGEARIAVDRAITRTGDAPEPPAADAPRLESSRRAAWLPWGVAAAAAVVAVVSVAWRPVPAATPAPLRLSTELGTDDPVVVDFGAGAVLSPDGAVLAFVARPVDGERRQLYIRELGALQARVVSGTADARDPFFSPDGEWVAFFAEGKLKKTAVSGGAPVAIADAPNARGGAWGDDGRIVFQPINATRADAGSLMSVAAAGGTVERLIPLIDGEVTQRWPQILPGGAVLFTSHSSTIEGYEDATIVVQSLPRGERKVLVRGGYFARYVPSGHLLYMHEGTLFGVPFDARRLELAGTPAPVVEGVETNASYGGAQYAVGASTLVYLPGTVQNRGSNARPLLLFDRTGKSTPLRSTPFAWSQPRFAPDGRRLAVTASTQNSIDVWILDASRDILSRLTSDTTPDIYPEWTPDGSRIAYISGQAPGDIYWQRSDGSGSPQRLTDRAGGKADLSFHPSGKWLAFAERNLTVSGDLMLLPLDGNERDGWTAGEPTALLATPADERYPAFSPDGAWIAYSSNETGRPEIYVRPFPGPGARVQVSAGGGRMPMWSRARREIFYASSSPGTLEIMSAAYTTAGGAFIAERPAPWSPERFTSTEARFVAEGWTLHPDGAHIAGAPASAQASDTRDTVVLFLNFLDHLRRAAPAP